VRQGIAALVFFVFVPTATKRKYQSGNPLPHSKQVRKNQQGSNLASLCSISPGISIATHLQ
jgi:hypothetical protein